jgi:hypothetical protein
MRGNSFKAAKIGDTVTVWERGPFCGRCGKIAGKEGIGRKGKGWLIVEFADGTRTGLVPFDKVPFGDNSAAKDN